MAAQAVAIELAAALLNRCKGVMPHCIHDHGSEFCNSELGAVVKARDLLDIRTRARHPESNGIVARFNGTVRQDSDNYYGENDRQAGGVIPRPIDDPDSSDCMPRWDFWTRKSCTLGIPNRDGISDENDWTRRDRCGSGCEVKCSVGKACSAIGYDHDRDDACCDDGRLSR